LLASRTDHGGANAGGERNPLVLAAAALAGVDRVFCIGGAQAVGALAYGTQIRAAVDKIVGPGNAYVAAAKRRVFGVVGIDMVAGPSEILVICDGQTDPGLGGDGSFFAGRARRTGAVDTALPRCRLYRPRCRKPLDKLLPTMPRQEVIRAVTGNRGALIHVRDLDEACADRQSHCTRAPGAVAGRC
jgi:histidinol dehydrogenase